MRMRNQNFEDLVNENKEEMMQDEQILNQIETRMEKRQRGEETESKKSGLRLPLRHSLN